MKVGLSASLFVSWIALTGEPQFGYNRSYDNGSKTHTSQLTRDQMLPGTDYDICSVITTAGDSVALKEISGRSGMIKDSTIVGLTDTGKLVKIQLSRVQSVRVNEFAMGETILLAFGGLGVASGILVWMAGGPLAQ